MRVDRPVLAAVVGLALLLAGCGRTTRPEGQLVHARGTGGGGSGLFTPDRSWRLAYEWDCAQQLAEGRSIQTKFAFEVTHADDGTLLEDQSGLDLDGAKGSGHLDYARKGAYAVAVNTDCEWKLNIDERDEASGQ